MECLQLVPNPERCCTCRANTKMYLDSLQNRTHEQEQALTSITRRAGTRVDYVPLTFEEEEEENLDDMTETDDKVIHEYIETYNESFRILYDYCLLHNLLNRTFLDSTMHRYRVTVVTLLRCTLYENACIT